MAAAAEPYSVRRIQQGWRFAEIATGHDAMVSAPDELVRMLISISK